MLILNILLAAVTYLSPVRFEVLLSGNFGEPRPNHFHAGLDIKTQQVEGKAIHVIGDGFVSRVTVSDSGTGLCLYVRHPDGYTSVYGHLQRFSPVIEALVKREQYRTKDRNIDLSLQATDCPVRKGQIIALSGDTGTSFGPHLHLEIHRTDNWDLVDPLELIPDLLTDTVAPVANAFMAYPIKGAGKFCGSEDNMRLDLIGDSITRPLTAWGKVGFAILANDYMQGSPNRCGVRHTSLLVDSKEVFSSDVNNIPPSQHLMVNVWGDYDYFDKNGEWFLKSFITPTNKLPIFKADKNKGVINFNEERDYHLTYVISDFFGNKSEYHFVVKATPVHVDTLDVAMEEADSLSLQANHKCHITVEGGEMDIAEGVLMASERIKPMSKINRRGYSAACRFSDVALPLNGLAEIRLKIDKEIEDHSKLYVVSQHKARDSFVKAEYHDGWLCAKVDNPHALFWAEYDDSPPKLFISPPRENEMIPLITLTVTDNKSGIAYVTGYIDEEFILFEQVNKTNRLTCNLDHTPVQREGRQRELKIDVADNCGNHTIETLMFQF